MRPALGPSADVSERLHTRLARMGEALDRARADDVEGTRIDYEKLYRYLGGFRGLSEAGIAYATVSGTVDWEAWREARF